MLLTLEMYKRIKRMNYREMQGFLTRLVNSSRVDGIREGESEFNDAVIVSVGDAIDVIGQEAVNKLTGGN